MNSTKQIDILLVEDKKSDADITIRALQKNNVTHSILHVKDGKDALDYLAGQGLFKGRNINYQPRAILLDLKMTKINGVEVLRSIKSKKNTSKIPVIIFTSSRENKDITECYLLGANSYLVKPVDYMEMQKLILSLGQYWLQFNQLAV